MNLLDNYFNDIDTSRKEQLKEFLQQIEEWNQKINLISRKDIEQLTERHLLPSLAIAKICQLAPKTTVMDVGTGGGFPGLPLAICFPEVQFTLVDSIGKKIRVVEAIAQALGLKNVTPIHTRVESIKKKFDFVIGRAVTALPKFLPLVEKNLRNGNKSSLENGILYLKGGDLSEELAELGNPPCKIFQLDELFDGQYCQDKCLLYLKTR